MLPAITDTLREPGLPGEVMPPHWPGPHLRSAIAQCTQTFADTTGPYLERLLK